MTVRTDWPGKALQCLKTSSRVDLEGEHIDDLARLGQPKMMRQFNLSYCQISSIEGLKPLPQLESFSADGSQISSLKNFTAISNIRKLSLRQTPVSQNPQFTLSVLLVCPNITSLNGRQISQATRNRAFEYPTLGRVLVDNGWMAEWPIPDEERLTQLCVDYNVPTETEEENKAAEEESDEVVDRFEEVLESYYKQHRKLVRSMKQRVGLPVPPEEEEDEEEEEEDFDETSLVSSNGTETKLEDFDDEDQEPTLVQRLAEILRENNVEIDENDMYNSVLTAIEDLCAEQGERKLSELMAESDNDSSQENQ